MNRQSEASRTLKRSSTRVEVAEQDEIWGWPQAAAFMFGVSAIAWGGILGLLFG